MKLKKQIINIFITLLVISITAIGYAAVTTVSEGELLTATLWNEMKDIVNNNETKLANISSSGNNVDISGTHTSSNQPGFLEYIGHTSSLGYLSDADYIDGNGSNYNIGNHWSRSTGKFVAPITGRYLVNTHIMGSHSASILDVRLRKNGSDIARTYGNSGTNYKLGTMDGVFLLNAGDYLQVYNSGPSSIYGDDSWISVNLLY